MKTKINLGAGNDILNPDEYYNHDIRKHRSEIDVAFDLNDKDWPDMGTPYRGDPPIIKFDEIRAFDVIEHLNDPINFMDNCWDLLEAGGILYIKACGWQNPNYWVDITHKKAFDIKSFDYFVPTTLIGNEYGYYTEKKWAFVKVPWHDKRNNVLVKLTPLK